MKKLLAVALAALMVFSFAACGGNEEDVLERVKADGKLVVATSPDFAPTTFKNPETGEVMGVDIEVARYIAKYLSEKYDQDIELVIEEMTFDACAGAVDAGQVDLSLNGYGWREDRAEAYYLTAPYNLEEDENSFQGVLTLAENAAQYTTKESFDGKKIAAQNGSLQQGFVQDQLSDKVEYVPIANIERGLTDLIMGRIDGLATTSETGQVFIDRNDTSLAMVPFHFEYDSQGTVGLIKKDQTNFGRVIDEALDAMNNDPEVDFIKLREDYTAKALALGVSIG